MTLRSTLGTACLGTVVIMQVQGAAQVSHHLTRVLPQIEVAGRYEYGWEKSSFRPCGSRDHWWVVPQDSVVAQQLRVTTKAAREGRQSTPDQGLLFARFRGDTSGIGKYGHLARYRREFRLSEVIEFRDSIPTECK